jgi:hypothetical protein
MTSRPRVHLRRAEAVLNPDGQRHCAACGDFIDPVDWCGRCREAQQPCKAPHRRLRKRADAAFCGGVCRAWHRSTFMSALPKGEIG